MREFSAGSYDVAVIGAGHAGIEASLACARLGMKTVCFTINLDAVGNMPCNPAIGGTGKGHLVRELDALGGEMARAADLACIQYRMLNRGKGPAVWSLRAQADRRRYQSVMKHTLETQENLLLRQAEIVDLRVTDGHVSAVVTETGGVYAVRAVILCSGTFLDGRTIVGECVRESGPDGMHASLTLADALKKLGLPLRRFKTGTPPRVNARSVDFSQMEVQTGDKTPLPFSFSTEHPPENQAVCYLTYTTEETHRVIRENLDRSPIYSGVIEGVGPRYCPSIETKIVRFPDKPRHQLFIEPMGLDTKEMYLQGHEIANHGYNHKLASRESSSVIISELLKTDAILREITGVKPVLYAPPAGDFTQQTVLAAAENGYSTVMWSIDTIDWRDHDCTKIKRRILDNAAPGAFILTHPTADTVEALSEVMERLCSQGYSFCTVSGLIAKSAK